MHPHSFLTMGKIVDPPNFWIYPPRPIFIPLLDFYPPSSALFPQLVVFFPHQVVFSPQIPSSTVNSHPIQVIYIPLESWKLDLQFNVIYLSICWHLFVKTHNISLDNRFLLGKQLLLKSHDIIHLVILYYNFIGGFYWTTPSAFWFYVQVAKLFSSQFCTADWLTWLWCMQADSSNSCDRHIWPGSHLPQAPPTSQLTWF